MAMDVQLVAAVPMMDLKAIEGTAADARRGIVHGEFDCEHGLVYLTRQRVFVYTSSRRARLPFCEDMGIKQAARLYLSPAAPDNADGRANQALGAIPGLHVRHRPGLIVSRGLPRGCAGTSRPHAAAENTTVARSIDDARPRRCCRAIVHAPARRNGRQRVPHCHASTVRTRWS